MMEGKVTRKEVNVFVDGNKGNNRPISSTRLASQGKNLIVGNTSYDIPDPNSLAAKYGIESDHKLSSAASQQLELEVQRKDQHINELESAVSSLKHKVEEKNRKIENLCVMLEAVEPTPGINPSKLQEVLQGRIAEDEVDLRDGKIVSLAKKSHKLTMQVNKERTVNSQLSDEISEWKRRYEILVNELETVRNNLQQKNETKIFTRSQLESKSKGADADRSPAGEDSSANNPLLQKQLKESLKMVDELKKKNKELHDENATLTKTLKKEIGDNISVEQAVDSGWRGRSQQIIMLKSKVSQSEGLA
jgi:chromosome segregation ATPase